jgi:hypothetical protein
MRASDWLNTASGTVPFITASTSLQPLAGQPGPGMPPECTAPGLAQSTRVCPLASPHVLPVGSVFGLPWSALKKPFCVGISWSSPWRIPEVECVAG